MSLLAAFGYTDYLKLLRPNVWALHQMVHICERYAYKFDVLFNSKKSQISIYKAYKVKIPDPCVTINGIRDKCGDQMILLGHLLTENVYEFIICQNVHSEKSSARPMLFYSTNDWHQF